VTDDVVTDEGERTMLVTGAGSGIGAAVAERAARDGWRLTLAGRRRDRLDEVAAHCADRADVHVADVTDPEAVAELVAATVRRRGRLDCVVANAGVMTAGTVLETEPADWDRTIATNLTAAYHLARAALPALLDARGSLVAVASIAALRAPSGSAAYAVSKAGLVMLAQTVARDFGGRGVRANVVCPGWVRTEMADEEMAAFGTPYGLDRDASYDEITRLVPQGRPAQADEVAAAVAWLAGPEASYVNGACLVVDGGTVLVDPGTVGFDFTVAPRNPRDSQ
jgi:meso-butanediol dehydrogenase / (S,S)-butanediol dehydrogenase / diacetyl reductase